MKLTSPKTYCVVAYALDRSKFKQLEAHDATAVSFGLVNRVINWMVSRGYAVREHGGYRVVASAALAQAFSLFRRMEELRKASFSVNADEKEVVKSLMKKNAVLCLTTALSYYDEYFRDPVIHAYAGNDAAEMLKDMPEGRTMVEIYEDDLKRPDDFVRRGGSRLTGRIRTVIDLLCSQRAYAASRLIKKAWG